MVATVSSGRRTVRPVKRSDFERLRRGDLVDQVKIDVDQRRLTGRLAHSVRFPDLLEECLWCGCHKSAIPRLTQQRLDDQAPTA